MKRAFVALGFCLLGLAAVAWSPASGETAWTVLFDGQEPRQLRGRSATPTGVLEDGAAVADKGNGFLVTKATYTDYEIRAESSGSAMTPTAASSCAAPIRKRSMARTPTR